MAKIIDQGPSQAEIDAAAALAAAATGAVDDDAALCGETKNETFTRLATKRVTSAMDKIRLVGNLTSANYEYTDEQASRIIGALQDSLNDLARKFAKVKEKKTFSF